MTTFPLIQPTRRFALLVNNNIRRGHLPSYARITAHDAGNRSIWQISAALEKGRLDLTHELRELFERAKIGDESLYLASHASLTFYYLYTHLGWKGCQLMRDTFPEESFAGYIADHYFECLNDAGIPMGVVPPASPYAYTARVYPNSPDTAGEIVHYLNLFGAEADESSLTFVFLFGHGYPGGFANIDYTEWLVMLDRVPGYKAIVTAACYAGGFVQAVSYWPARERYAVVSSGTHYHKSGEAILTRLTEILRDTITAGQPVSTLMGRCLRTPGQRRTTQAYLGFDFVL